VPGARVLLLFLIVLVSGRALAGPGSRDSGPHPGGSAGRPVDEPRAAQTPASSGEAPRPTLVPAPPPGEILPPPQPNGGKSWEGPKPEPASQQASPSAAAAAQADPAGAPVRIHDRKVFFVKVARGGVSPTQRALEASHALERAVDDSDEPVVRVVEEKDEAVVLFAGNSPVIQFGPADAEADGDASVKVHAEAAATKVSEALAAERKRSAIATTVFSISLLVLSGLLAFLVLRKLGELVDRGRTWMVDHPEGLPQLRIANVEVLQRASIRGVLLVVIDAAKWISRIGVAYVWLLFALARFESTRAYGERLGGVVLAPVSALVGRAVSAFPMLIILAVAGLAVVLLVRFVGLFFGSVARGETRLEWVPTDLASPTSTVVRAGIVLVALVLAAPLVTGTDDGALSRAGIVALASLGFASTPLLASAVVGVAVVFGRRLRVGEFAEVGGRSGLVRSISLLEVALRDADGCDVRIPHLVCLFHPTRLLGAKPPVTLEVNVSSDAPHGRTLEVLGEAAKAHGTAKVQLLRLDAGGVAYAVTIHSADAGAKTLLACAIADALAKAGIALGGRQSEIASSTSASGPTSASRA